MLIRRKGQSTLEYVAIWAAVVAAVVGVAASKMKPAVEGVMSSSTGKISSAASSFNQ